MSRLCLRPAFLSLLLALTITLSTISAQAVPIRIAENDGSADYSVATYNNGFGILGDANFIVANLSSYDPYGSNITIRVQMGSVTDYFRPIGGATLLEMLTSFTKHTWSPTPNGPFITPAYYTNHLGGSAVNWPAINVANDDRTYLSFWGSNNAIDGGCCDTNYAAPQESWSRPFTMDIISGVPVPAALPMMAAGLGGLILLARRRS